MSDKDPTSPEFDRLRKWVETALQRQNEASRGAPAVSNDKLIVQLKEWCQQAEATGIQALQEFSDRLKQYTLAPASAAV